MHNQVSRGRTWSSLKSGYLHCRRSGTDIFLDCAYHETLHALGLMNHADDIPWTTLNQRRSVGYLSVYDRAMFTNAL